MTGKATGGLRLFFDLPCQIQHRATLYQQQWMNPVLAGFIHAPALIANFKLVAVIQGGMHGQQHVFGNFRGYQRLTVIYMRHPMRPCACLRLFLPQRAVRLGKQRLQFTVQIGR
ncbi:hypothetical protein CO609_08930 [Lysobacteraceae bacterium NML91-0268]|nr:hypothetical protein CO609_08930 [Xanthomonadaceae bacterium NML91-0268]